MSDINDVNKVSADNSDKVLVILFTTKFKVQGHIHLLFKDSYRGRLSDHLNSDRMPSFFPVTEASMYDFDGQEILNNETIMVNRNHIEAVIELENE